MLINKLVLIALFIGSTQNVICQNSVEDSLGLIWKLKAGEDSLYEFQGINTVENKIPKTLTYNEFEKYFFNFIDINPKKKIVTNYKNQIQFFQKSNGIAVEINFYCLPELLLHYNSIIEDLSSKLTAEKNDFYFEDGDITLGHGMSWSGGSLGKHEVVVFIKIQKGLINKSELNNYQIINPVLRIECSK